MFNGGYRERVFENVGSWTRLGGNVSGETFEGSVLFAALTSREDGDVCL